MKNYQTETIDEKIDKCWDSRWIAISEDEYQCVITALNKLIRISGGQYYIEGQEEVANKARKTLNAFKRNQDIHYRSREEHRKLLKEKKQNGK